MGRLSKSNQLPNWPEPIVGGKYLKMLDFEPVGDTPEQFAAFLVNDRKVAEQKVKISGAKLD